MKGRLVSSFWSSLISSVITGLMHFSIMTLFISVMVSMVVVVLYFGGGK